MVAMVGGRGGGSVAGLSQNGSSGSSVANEV